MHLEEIKNDLIAFKGSTFIYAKSHNKNADPVLFFKILSINDMKLIDENPAFLNCQD